MNKKLINKPIPLFDTLSRLKDTATTVAVLAKYEAEFYFALNFLLSYRGSEATFNAYRREIERLLQWSWLVNKKSILKLKRNDIENFLHFCEQPPAAWVSNKQVRRFINKDGKPQANPEWKPFTQSKAKELDKHHTLSHKAIQAIFAIVSSFYNYLIQEDAIAYNPVAQIRQKSRFIRKQQQQTVVRRLSDLQWSYVLECANKLAQTDAKYERTLFAINALYGMYLRISELTASARWQPQMGHFYSDNDKNWWFKTVGKGNKERVISVSDAMLNALVRYRQHLGLANYPAKGETIPLISKIHTNQPITSTRQIRNIVTFCFKQTIAQLIQDGLSDEAEALGSATVHWLRHTGISDDVKIRPREHVRDDAGHGSSSITDRYIDVNLRERHASAKHKPIDPLLTETE